MRDKPDLHLVESTPVSDDSGRDAVARGLALYDQLHAAHDDAITRADSFERSLALANHENERLRREIKQVRAQRDHFMKAFTALKAKLQGFVHFAKSGGELMDEAIHMSEVQAYGETPNGRPTPVRYSDDGAPAPAFLVKPQPPAS